MAVPTYDQLMLPLLRLAGAGRASDLPTAEKLLAEEFQLSADDRTLKLPSGQQTALRNRTGWASFYLMKAGLLNKPKRGFFEITSRGRDVLKSPPPNIDKAYLSTFPEFVEFLMGSSTGQGANSQPASTMNSGAESVTPDEALQGVSAASRRTRLGSARKAVERESGVLRTDRRRASRGPGIWRIQARRG